MHPACYNGPLHGCTYGHNTYCAVARVTEMQLEMNVGGVQGEGLPLLAFVRYF